MASGNNPFRGFIDTISENNRMRERWMTGYNEMPEERSHANAWVPTTDIFAKDEDLIIRCELAGVSEDNVDISLSNEVLTVSGERTDRPENVVYYSHERNYGNFRRSMTLPDGVGQSDIKATFDNGMLEIVVAGGAKPKEPARIDIGTK